MLLSIELELFKSIYPDQNRIEWIGLLKALVLTQQKMFVKNKKMNCKNKILNKRCDASGSLGTSGLKLIRFYPKAHPNYNCDKET